MTLCSFRLRWPTWRKTLNLPQSYILMKCLSFSSRRSFLESLRSILNGYHIQIMTAIMILHLARTVNPSSSLRGADQSEVLQSSSTIWLAFIIRWNMYSKPLKFRKLEDKGQMRDILDFLWRSCVCCLKWMLLQVVPWAKKKKTLYRDEANRSIQWKMALLPRLCVETIDN